jgi:CheY-like chemotaxis protein
MFHFFKKWYITINIREFKIKGIVLLNKILYVEDDNDIQTIGKITLETFGNFTVTTCNSGLEALKKVKDVMPDLILMDVMMPEMDGLTALMEFKKDPELAKIPVVFMTAKAQVHEVERYIESGATGVIVKPFDPVMLCPQIKEIWEKFNDERSV